MRVAEVVLLTLGLSIAAGCGDGGSGSSPSPHKDAETEDPGGGGQDASAAERADTGTASSAGEGGTPVPRVDPAQVPLSFSSYDKARCGELGERCTFTDGSNCEGAICDLGIELCLPKLSSSQGVIFSCAPGGCDPAAPYCLGGRCLTLEQASCVCGAAGGAKKPECAGPAISALGAKKDASGNVCLTRDARCAAPHACCSGLACNMGPAGVSVCEAPCVKNGEKCAANPCCGGSESRCLKLNGTPDLLCYQRCSEHAQCASGCCSNRTDPMGGFCVEASRCTTSGGDAGTSADAGMTQCQPDGQGCGPGSPCCTGSSCVVQTGATMGTCRQRCDKPADCASGCCKPFASSPGGFCADALQCMCVPQGSACGGDSRSCCEGSRCARFGDAPASCTKTCQSSADCGGNCCQPLEGGANVCGLSPC